MNSTENQSRFKLLKRFGCCLFALAMVLLVLSPTSQGAIASQDVTLTLTYSTPSSYTPYNYLLNVSASAPVTGPIKLYWTINGEGPFENTTQITNGSYERTFGCPNPGDWTLWVVWAGNDQYGPSESNSITVQGDPEGPPLEFDDIDYTMYAIAVAIVILTMAVIAILYMKSRGRR